MQPIRRRQLIDATIRTIARVGYPDATVAKIAKDAGLSVGIISHYFGGKQALLEAAMAQVLFDLHTAFVARLEEAETPRARLSAIIATNFDDDQYQPEIVRAWLAFWAQVPFSPGLARLQAIYSNRLLSNLRHALRALGPGVNVTAASELVASLIDGFWLRSVVTETPPTLPEIRATIEKVVDHCISDLA
nr:transcriptional regulator BetI [Kordiimonas marina]